MRSMIIKVLNPTARPLSVEFEIAPRVDDLNGKVIGLLDNGKPNFDILLDRIEKLLCKRFKIADVVRVGKGGQVGAGAALPLDQMERLVTKCDAVVNGMGD